MIAGIFRLGVQRTCKHCNAGSLKETSLLKLDERRVTITLERSLANEVYVLFFNCWTSTALSNLLFIILVTSLTLPDVSDNVSKLAPHQGGRLRRRTMAVIICFTQSLELSSSPRSYHKIHQVSATVHIHHVCK